MNPASLGVAVAALKIIQLVDWKKIGQGLVSDAIRHRLTGLFQRLRPDEREKAARLACTLFADEFLVELEDKTPLSSALPGYQDQLKRLIEHAAPEIAGWMHPETKDVDLDLVARMWSGLGLDPLPEGFNWKLVAASYARAIRKHVKNDAGLRDQLAIALQEKQAETLERIAGSAAGFHLDGYREFLRQKCAALQLAVMHASTYQYDRRITLWNVFVEQSARESAPVRELSRELARRLKEEGQLTLERDAKSPNCGSDSRAAPSDR